MAKLSLTDLANLENETTAVAAINDNNTAIETALENTLSRDGTSPNTMGASLDMNSNRIVNLPEPLSNTEPLRVIDAVDLAGLTVTPETAAGILAKLITVDGAASGLDADLLDGSNGADFVKYADHGTLVVTNLDVGASGVGGQLDIFPATANRGKFSFVANNNTGTAECAIINAQQTVNAIWTIPDTNGSASFVMTAAAQTIGGAKTFSAAGVFSSTLDITGALTGAAAIKSTHATSGVGYGIGAGGTVTQASSKSQGVTLDKICGQITMNNAALNAGVEVSFTVTCSACAAGDVIVANHAGAGTAGAYMVQANTVGAGSFGMTVTNLSAGNLSEAIVLNYAIIKSVAS